MFLHYMRRLFCLFSALALLACACDPETIPQHDTEIPSYKPADKKGHISYQLLIYSFADSDGDGIGDFNGIKQRLDYLDGLGVSAIWLSPAHPADSYHGYDVQNYTALNPKYGTEDDFKALLDAAHAKGIKVYMDYVLNHTGKGHPWFSSALAEPSGQYRNYYLISETPSSGYKSFPMLAGYSYNGQEWHAAQSGAPKLTISSTSEAVTGSGGASWNLWAWEPGREGKVVTMKDGGNNSYYAVMDINGKMGFLVRKYPNWDAGSKFGAQVPESSITEGVPMTLAADGGDMYFTGNGRYRVSITDAVTSSVYYMGAFGSWMPDLNYGDVSKVEENACFLDMAASVDKWIGLGIDGLRLDAVKHIYGGMNSFNNAANRTFLKKWYDRCNATYRKTHSEDFYMVGEVWLGTNEVAPYYSSIPACFEFDFWERLKWVLNQQTGCYFAKDIIGYRDAYKAVNPKAIAATKLANHDETRAATILGRDMARMKQAAAMLLTTEGEPYIYQGEELGYWGKDSDDGGADELVRTPIVWDKAATAATGDLGGRIDGTLVTDDISVANQQKDEQSLLHTYYAFTQARNTCPALANGQMSRHPVYNDSNTTDGKAIAAWYMSGSDGSKALVLHNVGTSEKALTLDDDNLNTIVVKLGSVNVSGKTVTLGANSSAVFLQ